MTARDGTPLRAFAEAGGVCRYPASEATVSPLYIEALLAYEDRWFRRHPGVNPVALLRAGRQAAASGRIVSGGSTLTMQVARILEPHPRTLPGKLRQVLRALQLEAHLDKAAILRLYLERAPSAARSRAWRPPAGPTRQARGAAVARGSRAARGAAAAPHRCADRTPKPRGSPATSARTHGSSGRWTAR